MTSTYRVGVIGAGLKGTQHARAYLLDPRTEVVAVAERDPDVLDLFQRRFGLERGYTDYREMLANERIDIAAPILPSTVIPEVVHASVDAGVRAIFCEKPMCVTLEEADAMTEACAAAGVLFASGDAERNYDSVWAARDMIASGDFGAVKSITIYGGLGEMWGGGCQSLSVMRLFAWDADVERVVGWVEGDPWSNDDQGMGGNVHFANGVDARIIMRAGERKGIEVVCERGRLWNNWRQVRLTRVDDEGVERESVWPEHRGWGPGLDAEGWLSMAERQEHSNRSFLDALDSGGKPRCDGENMRKVLEIIVALRESHRAGYTDIELPIRDRSLGVVPTPARAYGQRSVSGDTSWYWPALMGQKPEAEEDSE